MHATDIVYAKDDIVLELEEHKQQAGSPVQTDSGVVQPAYMGHQAAKSTGKTEGQACMCV